MARTYSRSESDEYSELGLRGKHDDDDDEESEDDGCLAATHSERADVLLDQVLLEERELIDLKAAFKVEDGTTSTFPRGEPFTLAFSGGGIRAAAFQSGVLWKLAETGRLKDVEMLSAVSGGGYIAAAYASQLNATERPEAGDNVDHWYKDVVARTIVRMQANTGAFVRDCGVDSSLRGGCLNRVYRKLDCPIMLLATLGTMLVNPLTFLLLIAVPFTEFIDLFFGSGMRAAFCLSSQSEVITVLNTWCGPLQNLYLAIVVSMVAAFFFWVMQCFMKPLPIEDGERFHKVDMFYILISSVNRCLHRITLVLVGTLLSILLCVYLMRWSWEIEDSLLHDNMGGQLCAAYTGNGVTQGRHQSISTCTTNMNASLSWETLPQFHNVSFETDSIIESHGSLFYAFRWLMNVLDRHGSSPGDIAGLITVAMLGLLLFSIALLPFVPQVFSFFIAIFGPIFMVAFLLDLIKFRVYGNLTDATLMGMLHYNEQKYILFSTASSLLALPLMLCYQNLRAMMHNYYRKILKFNFFADGLDPKLADMATNTDSGNAYCPLLLMTGTASDFVRPGDNGPHVSTTEISFTPLHIGSEKTGYVRMPTYLKLSTVTALTGAGGVDAVGLSLNDSTKMRFWVEALNLTWGEFVLFQPTVNRGCRRFARSFGDHERSVTWFLLRIPTLVTWFIIFSLFAAGTWTVQFGRGRGGDAHCRHAMWCYGIGVSLLVGLFVASFFSYFKCCSATAYSPLLRCYHQLMRYYYVGNRPPPMLYITDGGAVDCTTITQLVMRRTRRIFLALAGMDPHDDLEILRKAFHECTQLKLCSFYGQKDPQQNVKVLLDNFKADPNMAFMHIGIKYGWSADSDEGVGHMVVIKNRLREDCRPWPIMPLLTQEEITGWPHDDDELEVETIEFDAEAYEEKELAQEDLGGLLCCDHCHLRGCNYGGKWPKLTGLNYLWLTPQLFNGLCRLGHLETGTPLDIITGPLPGI